MTDQLPMELWVEIFRHALMPLVPNYKTNPEYPFAQRYRPHRVAWYPSSDCDEKIFVDLVCALRLTCRTFHAAVSSIDFVRRAFPRVSYLFNRADSRLYDWHLDADTLKLNIQVAANNSDYVMKQIENKYCMKLAAEVSPDQQFNSPYQCGCGRTGEHCGDGHLVELLLLPKELAIPQIFICAFNAHIWIPGVAQRLNQLKDQAENAGRYCHVQQLTIEDSGEDHEWYHVDPHLMWYKIDLNVIEIKKWTDENVRALNQALERWTPPGQERILRTPFVCSKCDTVNYNHLTCAEGCGEFCPCASCEYDREYEREYLDNAEVEDEQGVEELAEYPNNEQVENVVVSR